MKIAIDIGGTFIKSCVIDDYQTLHGYSKIQTPTNETNEILNKVIDIVEEYKEHYQLDNPAVGISTAGVVNSKLGIITYAGPTIPGYDGTNFKEGLKAITNRVEVHNDVSCALLGELPMLKGKVQSVFLMTIGTGIGGAYFENNLLEGKNFKACEIGYLLYEEKSDTTYEDRASTTALKKRIKEAYMENVPVEKLFEMSKAGDYLAIEILNNWAKHVAQGIAQIQIIFDPEIILIGGGISKQEEYLVQLIEPYIDSYLPINYGHANITTTSQGNDSALYGAISKFI